MINLSSAAAVELLRRLARRVAPSSPGQTSERVAVEISVAGLSDVGQVRSRNEDAFAVSPEMGLVAVADGMGGCPAGDVASEMAIESLMDHWKAVGDEGAEAATDAMHEGVKRANSRILLYSRENPERQGMGTTLTAMWLETDSGRFVVGHVGDSRVYRFVNGAMEQLTTDHTWVQSQVEKGSISPEAARLHPFGHILAQALGVDPELDIDVLQGSAAPGELYLLCTDGLTTALEDDLILDILSSRSDGDLDQLASELVAAANEAGGPDNVTVALVRVV